MNTHHDDEPLPYQSHKVTVRHCDGPGHTPTPRTVTITSPDQQVHCEHGHRMHG